LGVLLAAALVAVTWWWRPDWTWVWGPAVVAAVLFSLVLLGGRLDRRLRTPRRLPEEAFGRRQQVSGQEQWRVATERSFVVVGALAATGLLIASIFLSWPVVTVGSLLVLGWGIVLGLPAWAAGGDGRGSE